MTTRRTIRIEVTDIGEDGPGFDGPLNRESATLVRDWQMTMGHDLMPSQVVERIRGWLDGDVRGLLEEPGVARVESDDLTFTEREADRNARGGS